MADDLTAALARIGRSDTAGIKGHPWVEDVPRLLAAVGKVLKRHQPGDGTAEVHTLEAGWHSVTACGECGKPWPCPTVQAISAGLLGKEDGDGH